MVPAGFEKPSPGRLGPDSLVQQRQVVISRQAAWFVLVALVPSACGGSDDAETVPRSVEAGTDAPSGDALMRSDVVAEAAADGGSGPEEADGASEDARLEEDAGDSASVDAATEAGAPADAGPSSMPIRHVVVIVKENHTFDNYFGSFPGAEGTLTADGNICTTPAGKAPCAHAPDAPPHDLCHEHSCALIDYDHGALDGWNKPGGSDTGDSLAYAQYTENDIPNYWQYARHFVLGDHFFANELGPSFPGHFFLLAAQAGWAYDNPPTDLPAKLAGLPPKFFPPHPYWGCDEWEGDTVSILAHGTTPSAVFPCFDIPAIPDILPAGVDWKFYGTNWDGFFGEVWSMFDAVDSIRNDAKRWSRVVLETQFAKDIQAHALPNVTWLVDQDQYSEHPNLVLPGLNVPLGGVCAGEGWTVKYVNQIMQSEYWQDTAIIITYDDFGGWYDHVKPPRQYGGTTAEPYGLGFRLPLLIISPYAKPGFIFKEVAEQASIARFIERVFGAQGTLHDRDPAAQDAQANDLLNAFDFAQKPQPPLILQPRACN
jgi:phospholipase C